MSIEGCMHGPTYLTGGPEACPDCAALREAEHLGTEHAKKLAAPLVEALRKLNERPKHTLGPYFVGPDDALDCPPHANSGLALVDTGRAGDWPIARLCEWPTAEFIARACNAYDDLVSALRAAVQRWSVERRAELFGTSEVDKWPEWAQRTSEVSLEEIRKAIGME